MINVKNQNVKIAKTNTILNRLDYSIKNKLPFSIVRFGDGTIKAIHAYLTNDHAQLKSISIQEGIPIVAFEKIINFWKTSANYCDYIDSPAVYFNNKFWKRTKRKKKQMSEKTIKRLYMWGELYSKIGITNKNYCNPEINFLSCIAGRKSLLDLLEGKKICCITSRIDAKEILSKYFDNIEIIQISGKNENQFINCFSKVINIIDTYAKEYDIWLIAAGELGRVYPGLIKFNGGRAFDVGSLIDVWCGDELPDRLKPYLTKTIHHPLKFVLTESGKEFAKYI